MTTTNTATDVAERLPRLLDELARSTPTQSEHTPFNPNVSMLLGDSRDAHRPRRIAAAAAVLLLIAGAGALAFAQPDNPGTTPAAATPSGTAATPNDPEVDAAQRVEPTLFPAIDEPPAGLEVTARIEAIPASSMFTEALIARSDGTVITDSVAITVQAEPFEISPMAGKAPTTTEVFGQPATVYDYGVEVAIPVVHVTWGTGPYSLATGSDPVAFLDAADSDTFAVSDADAAPVLTIGELPDGYAVIAEPTVVGRATTSATLSIGADNYDISVSTRNLIVAMAQAGPLRRVEVNGADGWMFDTTDISDVALTQDVAWSVDDSTYAYLKVNDGTNADDALALARRITFLDRNSWTARYLADGTAAADDALANGSAPKPTDPIGSLTATPATTGPATAEVPVGPRASLDLPGWTLSAFDSGDDTTIGAEYIYASADGKTVQINFYPGTLADRVTGEFPDDAIDVLSESQQVATYPNGRRFRYNAALPEFTPRGLDWVMEVDGEPFADQNEFMATVRAITVQ